MSRSAIADQSDRYIKELELKVAEQEAFVRRMIVRGTPSQAAEDRAAPIAPAAIANKRTHSHPRLMRQVYAPACFPRLRYPRRSAVRKELLSRVGVPKKLAISQAAAGHGPSLFRAIS